MSESSQHCKNCQRLENRNKALQAEANYYRRVEFERARVANFQHWMAVYKQKWQRELNRV